MAHTQLQRLVPEAPQALRDILDSRRGPVHPPIRSEIFGMQRFAQHGRSLGTAHKAAQTRARPTSFFPQLKANIQVLREAHRYIGLQASTGYDISPAAEWLLDNFHLIEAQFKEIHDGLPRSYFRTLPILEAEPLKGLPRVYGIAWAFVAHTDSAFDEDLLVHFLNAYQECQTLNLSEIWALPTTLRVVLIENLRRLAERVAGNKAAREVANLCCDRLETFSLEALDDLLALLNQRGVGRVFLTQMSLRLQDRRIPANPGASKPAQSHFNARNPAGDLNRYLDWLRSVLPDLAAAQTQQPLDQAADNLSVSNAVKSLRAIGDADWTDVIARSSGLMKLMLELPQFEAEDTATRDTTLHGIERLAKRYGYSEIGVAKSLVTLMQAGDDAHPAEASASHWLSGLGRSALVTALGQRERFAFEWRAPLEQFKLAAYLGVLALGSVALVLWILLHPGYAPPSGDARLWLSIGVAILMVFPASEAVVAVTNRLISESVKPNFLPRLALTHGIPREARVMVVIPAMLTSQAGVQALVHQLHLHYLANQEPHAQFALLSDWADADTATTAADRALLDSAIRLIQDLNQKYPKDELDANEAPRFIVLHRARVFSETEQRWIGWERKRGKLEQLITALATGQRAGFLEVGAASRMATDTLYVVTLDSDTQLPPGRLRELVGVAAHPDNQPQLDLAQKRVVQGYGILQPRVVTPLPAVRDFTLFHWLFAGQTGIDPYSAATSEVYQDVFNEGTFTGKGLLNVKAVHAVLSGRLPDGQVLSHDLLEGSLARCAAVTDITVIEDAPFHADVAASRVHRWTRGDWQLLPFLLQPRAYPFAAINRWKMFDNLRRSLVAPMSLTLILVSLFGWVISPAAALALVFAAFSAGPILGAVAGFSPSRDDLARVYFYRQAGIDLLRTLWGGLWFLTQLLQHSLMAVDAIARALYRMRFSRRHLLQWTTAASAQAQSKKGLPRLWRQHAWVTAIAFALLGLLLAFNTPVPAFAWAVCATWAASPLWIWWVSRTQPVSPDEKLPPQDEDYLLKVAEDSWRLFERCVGPQSGHLPPDNLQTAPYDMVAHRTSPTNMGLYLLSVACARSFGWIGTADLVQRLQATLTTMQQLQTHRGHFLNWYDTQTLAPLLPQYVSTVDSGNLSGHLLAVAQACLELIEQEEPVPKAIARAWPGLDANPWKAQLQALAKTCETLAWAPDYSFLYHRKRHLFHIGFRVAEQQLDASFYDLLASESRLTSLLAIAKGDVPVRHWASLGRPLYALGARAGLRSWSGSMFEYLMPTLVLCEPHGSVLFSACQVALKEQMAYAKEQGVPWGISESAYAARDHTLAYQYAPQGVPRLAFRRAPPGELVIAPYATALAAQISPHAARANFGELQVLKARGDYGFIEALDFSPSRLAAPSAVVLVETFMAHHQGMTIVALANVLLDGAARRWGMANAHMQAVGSLLHERAPRELSMLFAPAAQPHPLARQRRTRGLVREVSPGAQAIEPTHVLSNGRYSVTLRSNGAGWSRWGQTGITRWRDDALRDAHGSFFFLRWPEQTKPLGYAKLPSITHHPAPDPHAHYTSYFHADRVCFDAEWPQLQSRVTVWVSPEDDIEFRQVELRNNTDQPLEIELISAMDITLAPARADEAHPAFSNLFVRAEWQTEQSALLFERKPRLPTEATVHAAHFLADLPPQVLAVTVQTDRQKWLGRNRDASFPLAQMEPLPPPASPSADPNSQDETVDLNTGLDPVCALAVRLRIAPNSRVQLTFATAVSDNPATLHAIIDKYHQPNHVQRASLMSATLTGIRLHSLRINAETFSAFQNLTTALVSCLTHAHSQTQRNQGALAPACDRRLLWRHGISGDRPLILVSASAAQGLGLLRSLTQALRFWSWGVIACDLVIVNSEPNSYLMELQRSLVVLKDRHLTDAMSMSGSTSTPSTALFLFHVSELSAEELDTLQSLARVHLNADGRPLTHHLQEWLDQHEQQLTKRSETSLAVVPCAAAGKASKPFATGDFDAQSGEFRFEVSAHRRPKRPWINVLSNPSFGAQISESGGGYTWAVNSRLNQLTAWSNDPVCDAPSEWFLLQDTKTRAVWSVAPSIWGQDDTTYRVSHGQGYSTISHELGNLQVTVTWCVDTDTKVKQINVRLNNEGNHSLHLRLIGMVEWIMGASREDRRTAATTVFHRRIQDQKLNALMCTQNDDSAGFGNGTAFFSLTTPTDEAEDWTCDRRECFDACGALVLPDHFARQYGRGLDPCAALATRFVLERGASLERVFLLGYAESPSAASQLAMSATATQADHRLGQVRNRWNTLLGATQVTTPDPLFDAMVNRWLLYQTVSCRLWAKAGFYQAGGATGFRDQLQDAMAMTWTEPDLLRTQILLCASRQFERGDVQHWWHAPRGAGVRTHFSDDLLWLPHAVLHYLKATGETKLLDHAVPFIQGQEIPVGAEDAYFTPQESSNTASVYEHCALAIDLSLGVGVHGLPLIGAGDWNDGMNRIGIEGRGESVWLGWFLCQLVAKFAPLAQHRGDTERAARWTKAAKGWATALNDSAWDGQWFKRAFFDNGQALGSHANPECQIDLIAQAWAVLSQVAPVPMQRMALKAVEETLVDHTAQLIRLLHPPLVHNQPSAGYIQAYPPGVRENGGQYSHAGVWALMAQAEFARVHSASPSELDLPYRYFTYLSSAHRAADPQTGPRYSIEPYVMAGDVYSSPPYQGRGGWSWYTGAAAWMHRAAMESLFGLHLGADTLHFLPCLPSHWQQAELRLRKGDLTMRFILTRDDPHTVLMANAQSGAKLLQPAEVLYWTRLAGLACFVIPLVSRDGKAT